MRKSVGYTAIEFVVALAATATVLALSVSGLRTYVIRTQVAKDIETARRWGSVVEARFRADGRVPRTWKDVGPALEVPSAGHVQEFQLVDGRIDILYGRDAGLAIAGRGISLTPYQTVGQEEVVWICGNDIPGVGLEPLGFVGGGTQSVQVQATVASRYLPAECR